MNTFICFISPSLFFCSIIGAAIEKMSSMGAIDNPFLKGFYIEIYRYGSNCFPIIAAESLKYKPSR